LTAHRNDEGGAVAGFSPPRKGSRRRRESVPVFIEIRRCELIEDVIDLHILLSIFCPKNVGGYFVECRSCPEWFAQEIHRPKLKGPRFASFRQPPGHQNDLDRPQFGILFDSAANLEPADVGQINVRKNAVVRLFFGESQAIGARRRDANVKSAAFEDQR
jgi:hypothetical protein